MSSIASTPPSASTPLPASTPPPAPTPPPIDSLPFDIMETIFGHVCDAPIRVHRGKAPPVALALVCRPWQHITLTCHSLWSTLHVHDPWSADVSLARHWLTLAGTHPLTLSFYEPEKLSNQRECHNLLTLFAERREYWRSLDLSISEHTLGALYRPWTSRPEQLEEVKLHVHPSRPNQPIRSQMLDDVWRWLHSSKCLHSVDWGFAFLEHPDHCPFNQLHRMTVLGCQELLRLGPNCPHIEDVELLAFGRQDFTRVSVPTVVPSIKTLNMFFHDVGRFFDLVTRPSLEQLSLHLMSRHQDPATPNIPPFPFEPSFPNIRSFEQFLTRSGASLSNLTLSPNKPRLLEDLLVIPPLSSLRHLTLNNNVTEPILRILTLDEHDRLPHLESLHLSLPISYYSNNRDGVLAAMLLSRWRPNTATGLTYACNKRLQDAGANDDEMLAPMIDAGSLVAG